jgi:hypothetical protein
MHRVRDWLFKSPKDRNELAPKSEEVISEHQEALLKMLSLQYTNATDAELQEAHSELKQAGHSIDKFILGFTGAVLSLAATTYTSDKFLYNQHLRNLAIWLIFFSLLLSLANLIFAAASFSLQRRILRLIVEARSCIPHPNSDGKFSNREKFPFVLLCFSDILSLSKYSRIPEFMYDKGLSDSEIDSKISDREDAYLNTLIRIRKNRFSLLASVCLFTSVTLLLIGIGMMIAFLSTSTSSG